MVATTLYGGNASIGEVRAITTPTPTQTHRPIPHTQLLDLVDHEMARLNLLPTPGEDKYHLTAGGSRMFATRIVQNRGGIDWKLAIGIRNAHDKSMSAGVCFGSHVCVCANGMFTADHVLARKHTPNIERDLGELIARILMKSNLSVIFQNRLYNALKGVALTNQQADHQIVEACLNGKVGVQSVGRIASFWRTPPHDAFKPRTAWSLINAFTEEAKRSKRLDGATKAADSIAVLNQIGRSFVPQLYPENN